MGALEILFIIIIIIKTKPLHTKPAVICHLSLSRSEHARTHTHTHTGAQTRSLLLYSPLCLMENDFY